VNGQGTSSQVRHGNLLITFIVDYRQQPRTGWLRANLRNPGRPTPAGVLPRQASAGDETKIHRLSYPQSQRLTGAESNIDNVALGSVATDLRRSRDVRFYSESDPIAASQLVTRGANRHPDPTRRAVKLARNLHAAVVLVGDLIKSIRQCNGHTISPD
jgi:hypothetical protein